MTEEIICTSSPSQILNLKGYAMDILVMAILIAIYVVGRESWQIPMWFLLLILLPIVTASWRFFGLNCQKYVLTNERLKITKGILNRTTEEIELYRVKDFSLSEPFFMRLFKLGNISIETSDKTMPLLSITALPRAADFKEQLRTCVEEIRTKKNVREVDFE
jgi:uncharacterized membrane protein YdbT with pleckstrin-like domain